MISIILPVYNAEASLPRTLAALESQVYEDYEIIAIDDGSTDASPTLLDVAAAGHPDRFKVLHSKNGGVWQARKLGFEQACGDYIAFCDSDDEPYPMFIQTLAQKAADTNADIIVCAFERWNAEGTQILSIEMTRFGNALIMLADDPGVLPAINTALWNKLFRREVLAAGFDLAVPARVGEDAILNLAAYSHSHTLAFIDEPLYRYRTQTGSLMTSVKEEDFEVLERSFLEVRRLIACQESFGKANSLLAVCDLMAFIHIGISLQERFLRVEGLRDTKAGENRSRYRSVDRLVRTILDRSFPFYRRNPYTTFDYNRTHNKRNLMLMGALWAFRLRLLMSGLRLYRALTKNSGVGVGW